MHCSCLVRQIFKSHIKNVPVLKASKIININVPCQICKYHCWGYVQYTLTFHSFFKCSDVFILILIKDKFFIIHFFSFPRRWFFCFVAFRCLSRHIISLSFIYEHYLKVKIRHAARKYIAKKRMFNIVEVIKLTKSREILSPLLVVSLTFS